MGRKSKLFDYKKVDIYLAGLFDGEGCVTYSNGLVLRKGKKKAEERGNEAERREENGRRKKTRGKKETAP